MNSFLTISWIFPCVWSVSWLIIDECIFAFDLKEVVNISRKFYPNQQIFANQQTFNTFLSTDFVSGKIGIMKLSWCLVWSPGKTGIIADYGWVPGSWSISACPPSIASRILRTACICNPVRNLLKLGIVNV